MKKLGLIGGFGPESTIPYYHDIVYGVQERVGENIFPEITIESLNVFKLLELCKKEEYEAVTEYIMKGINHLIAAEVDFIAISANTPHIVFDELKKRTPIPMISIIEATCNEAKRKNMSTIGLLGTVFTMEGEFFRKPFRENGIKIVTPSSQERVFVNEKISKELELGIIKEETLSAFLKIIERMRDEDKIEAVVLGCTELPLLFDGVDMPVTCLDTMKIHIQTLINYIIDK